jgi:nicotinate phosphoribosyltransferase
MGLRHYDTPAKVPNPGMKSAWRLYDHRGMATADLLCAVDEDPTQAESLVLRHSGDHTKFRTIQRRELSSMEALHVEVMRQGKVIIDTPPLSELRQRRLDDVERLDPGIRRLVNPHIYHVSLTQSLWDLKQRLITEARNSTIHT